MKNTKLFVGISLMVQSVLFLVLSFVLRKKKRTLANAFAIVSAAGGLAGALCLVAAAKDSQKAVSDCCDGCCDCDGEYFDGEDFSDDDILCNFEDTDLYDSEEEPEEELPEENSEQV